MQNLTLPHTFDSIVRPMSDLIRALARQNEPLTQTRDLLLPRLISGKLSVEDLDIQFPPSMTGESNPAVDGV